MFSFGFLGFSPSPIGAGLFCFTRLNITKIKLLLFLKIVQKKCCGFGKALYICAMKCKVKTYLDNVFAARGLPTIAWGAFLQHLIACVNADGGKWNEIHGYFEFPPKLTGGSWEIVNTDEIRKHLGWT